MDCSAAAFPRFPPPLKSFMTNHSAMLEEALGAYEKAAGELEEFRARVSWAEIDEQATLDDHSLPEDQAIKQLTNAQKLKAVYTARAAHKEKELVALAPKLEEAIRPAEGDPLTEITQEAERRSASVRERVLEDVPELSCKAIAAAHQFLEVWDQSQTVLAARSQTLVEKSTQEAATAMAKKEEPSVGYKRRPAPVKQKRKRNKEQPALFQNAVQGVRKGLALPVYFEPEGIPETSEKNETENGPHNS